MKLFKYVLVLFMSTLIMSCSSDDDTVTPTEVPFQLTVENIRGDYSIDSFQDDTNSLITGTIVSSTQSVGSVFETAIMKFNTDGSFELSGQFFLTVTLGGLSTGVEESIINLDNVTGTYSLIDAEEDTIVLDFNSEIGGINLSGAYSVDSFSEELLVISFEDTIVEDSILGTITNEVSRTIRLVRN